MAVQYTAIRSNDPGARREARSQISSPARESLNAKLSWQKLMMLLAATALPRKQTVEWTSDAGRGYSVRVTPSLYHSSGVIEVYDII